MAKKDEKGPDEQAASEAAKAADEAVAKELQAAMEGMVATPFYALKDMPAGDGSVVGGELAGVVLTRPDVPADWLVDAASRGKLRA
jgi:hypothetical protein